jgi:hypothetical protein
MASESRLRLSLVIAFLVSAVFGGAQSVAAAIQPGHLYAGPLGGITLFPLDARGLPKATPDRVIPASATGLAFGPDGNLYAAVNYSAISVYAPGRTGSNTPLRSIQTPLAVVNVAVDAQGLIYAVMTGYEDVQIWVYAPTASGPAQPLRIIYLPFGIGQYGAIGIAFDAAGNLYADSKENVYVFANPGTNPTPIGQFCVLNNYSQHDLGLAFSSTSLLYVATDTVVERFQPPVVGCPVQGGTTISLRSLRPPSAQFYGGAIAVSGALLYAGALENSEFAIVVLKAMRNGPQTPLAILGGTLSFGSVFAVALGP